jgi:hypothetical protein
LLYAEFVQKALGAPLEDVFTWDRLSPALLAGDSEVR